MKNFLRKLKSNKGATGADVVVALSVIVVGMAVVSMIYISLSNGGKRVTRTSGATRIAVNIMENIERLDYTKFEYELGKLAYPYLTNMQGVSDSNKLKKVQDNLHDVILQLKSVSETEDKKIEITKNMLVKLGSATDTPTNITYDEVFGTKVPGGYDYIITVKSAPSGKKDYPWDLAARITVKVMFNVDNREESVTLQTVKYRELLGECNKPDMSMIATGTKAQIEDAGALAANAIPLKRSSSNLNVLEKCSETDSDWYNYSNKQWAMVYDCGSASDNATVANNPSSIVLDNTSKQNIKVWIPRYGKISYSSVNYYAFAYAQTVYSLYQLNIPSLNKNASPNDEVLVYCPMTFKELPDLFKLKNTGGFGLNNGIWVKYSLLESVYNKTGVLTAKEQLIKGLLSSQYGFKP